MHKLGKKFAVIGRILNVPADTVRKVWNRYQQTGTCESASRSGRPTKLTDRDRRQLKRYIPSGRPEQRKALQDISAILNLPIKPDTLKAEIRKFGLHLRIERKTPYLSHHQKAARLKFAWEYIHWTEEDWKSIAFSDEMAMQTAANQGIVWVWRYPEEEYDEDCCGPTQISGFRKVRVWGAIRYNKLSKLVIFPEKEGEGKLDAKEYCDEIIDKELFNFWRDGMEELGDLLIMEDGAPYHKGVASRRRSEYG